MFGMGLSEIVIILIVALIVIGPKNLPKAARTLGRLFGQLQHLMNEFQDTVRREAEEIEELERREKEEAVVVDAAEVGEQGQNQDAAELSLNMDEPEPQRPAPGPPVFDGEDHNGDEEQS